MASGTGVADVRAWLSASQPLEAARHVLPASCSEALAADAAGGSCTPLVAAVHQQLRNGCGFAVVALERPPADAAGLTRVFRGFGALLGQPISQDAAGSLVYDVRDTGAAVASGARFSVTNAESSFHTDGAFMPHAPITVGLVCLQAAQSGGHSQLVSAHTVLRALQAEAPDLLDVLRGPFLFDRRGQHGADEPPQWETPIVDGDGDQLVCRYLSYYIRVGHEQAGRPLSPAQEHALAAVDELLARPELQVEFHLEPGQMLFTNNRWILHNRTAFVDHAEPAKRRHLLRLWLA